VVDGAQQEGKYGAGNRIFSTRGKEWVSELRLTGDRPIFSAECQAEKWSLVTDISLLYEFESKTLNEKLECMERMETGKKQKQNTTGGKEFYDHGTWKGHNDIWLCN